MARASQSASQPVDEQFNLAAVTAQVVQVSRKVPATIWGFGVSGFLTGLIRAGEVLGQSELLDDVRQRVVGSLERPPDPTDHLIAIEVLMALRRTEPRLNIAGACERWLDAVTRAARPVPGQPRVHRPDLTPWNTTIWVDCMHTDGPGLAALGHLDEAVDYATEYASALQRKDGLFHHGYDVAASRGNGVAWGRGQCWALLGLLDTLERVMDERLHRRLERLLSALAEHEQRGRWHTVVDDPASPLEGSVGAYIAWAVRRAVELGIADGVYGAMADRAFDALLTGLDGGALNCSGATPVGEAESYHHQPTGAFPWGQGPVLHSLLDRLESVRRHQDPPTMKKESTTREG